MKNAEKEVINMTYGSVSLRFEHPEKNLSFLSSLLNIPCFRSWQAGSRRQTPKGTLLPGVYNENYWVSRLEFSPENGFEEKLILVIDIFKKVKKSIREFVDSGGAVTVCFQLPGSINNGGVIVNEHLLLLGELGVGLSIEVFPKMVKSNP